jgi:predicted RNase H-like HicB family nuclease
MMEFRTKAEELARRPYFMMTALDATTEGHPMHFARVPEIEGCFGQGKTREEAIQDLRLAMVDFIESLLEDGLPVPEPTELYNPTFGTASQGVFTFTNAKQSKSFQPKQSESYRDEYFLSAHAG